MSEFLTAIESHYEERLRNYRLIFGNPKNTEVLYRGRFGAKQIDYFLPGCLFCLDLWDTSYYGTRKWRVVIARTIAPGDEGVNIPQVSAKVRLLFDVNGQLKCKMALKLIKILQEENKDLLLLPDKYFEICNVRVGGMSTDDLKKYIKAENPTIEL